jgi:murein DD-endopeptidase MepM/ murein hydrolase activator NlpD
MAPRCGSPSPEAAAVRRTAGPPVPPGVPRGKPGAAGAPRAARKPRGARQGTAAAPRGNGGSDAGNGGSNAGASGTAGEGSGGTAGDGGNGTAGAGGSDAGAGGSDAGSSGSATGGAAGDAGAAGSAAGTGGSAAGESGAAGAGGEADCPRVEVQVADGATLNVRPTPSTQQAPVGKLTDGDIVDVLAQVKGEVVSGNDLWFQIQAPGLTGYISAQFAQCTLEKPPVLTQPDGFYLPLECGKTSKIAQGNNGSFSHQGKSLYAYDFSLALNTPMTAMADGVVAYLYDKTGPGDPCYNGGDSSCFPYANYVVLKHGDGSLSTYKHLNKVNVSLKQLVKRGTVIGLSGSTGYSTGPHAHVMRMEDCGQYSCQSIPLKFQDVGGDQVPDQGQSVTSGNCP